MLLNNMETPYLLQEKLEINNIDEVHSKTSIDRPKIILSVTLLLISVSLLIGTYNIFLNQSADLNSKTTIDLSTSNIFPFTLNREGYEPNQYFLEGSPLNMMYAKLGETIAIIEPYVEMNLYPKSTAYSGNDLSYYHYTLCAATTTSDCVSGKYYPTDSSQSTSVTVNCSPYDRYTLKVTSISTGNEVLSTSSGVATCLYVRREIRDLTDKDLAATMEAMHELWVVDTEEGQNLYGDAFISAKNLLEMHYFQASWRDTDHSHEGFGFLPHHLQMTNFFEASVQLVDPSITVPYWDYTRDSYPVTGKDVSNSYMFTNKTFGSIQPPKQWKYSNGDKVTDGAIQDSLWAFQIIEKNTRFPDMKLGYSYMRSPWSSNPSPYVSRFTYTEKELPTCDNHLEMFPLEKLQDFLDGIELDPHGNAHFTSGGVFGCDVLEPLVEEGVFDSVDDSYQFCQIWVLRTKFWYRDYIIQMKSDCYVENNDYSDHNNFKCGIECDSSDEGKAAFYNVIVEEASDYLSNTETSTLEKLRLFICEGDMHKIITGDQFISSSAADPVFWPIHGTVERLYHAKLMSSGFSDTTYTDSFRVCSHYTCFDIETKVYGDHKSCCAGHYKDQGLFDYINGDRNSFIGLSNQDMLKATDPTSQDYSMPYVYDNFKWPHCTISESGNIDSYLKNYYTY